MVITSSSSSASSSAEPKLYLQYAQATTIKLTERNFVIWKLQIVATINGYGLHKYLTGDHPKIYSTEEDEKLEKISKEYDHWLKQDQLLASWLVASMAEEMVTRMVGKKTSQQIWDRLATFFSGHTRAKERLLKIQLKNTKKGSKSISEYPLSIKKIVDELNSMGAPVSAHEHTKCIFYGLPREYESFVTNVSLRGDEYSVVEVEALLLTQETRIEWFKESTEPVSTNVAQTQSSNRNQTQNNRPPNMQYNNNNQRNPNFNRGGYKGSSNNFNRGRGRGRMPTNNNNNGNQWPTSRPQCQVCERTGHLAVNCYHSSNNSPMEAMIATPETLFDSNWYPNRGASNHIANSSANLQNRHQYDGSEKVFVGNGQGLSIPNIVLVKSQETKEVLLKGRVKDGLYCFDNLQLQHVPKNVPYSAYTTHTKSDFDL
ncbi:Retrovirus-related Pol polyprotein from transposon TNT 1-94 [Senna tora]|uniref:Retrovirus-related Pol polyprotein from transposon TNT 1-94 n=1 Tax=Senna tora TaxID=362788 RepID=A0A834WN88_9FABA|nr:Retrovirus-related Pol polyprotein from transposon TNT 1-94 [Senna tora]